MPGLLVAAVMMVVATCYAARRILPGRLAAEPGRVAGPVDRAADVAGLFMAAGMALMWSGSVVVGATTGTVAFTVMAVLLAVLWWRDGRVTSGLTAGRHVLHHAVACLAMAYMYTAGESGSATQLAAGHHGGGWLIVSWIAGVYFLVAASSLGFRLGSPAPPAVSPGRAIRRLTGFCDAAMSASMAAMLFLMV